jgi:uncharacterized surface protein with fasciclin (FAS1) repeats
MSSLHGTVQDSDFSFLYDKPKQKRQTNVDSLLYILENEPTLTKFNFLVQMSNMKAYFNDLSSTCTLFVPQDDVILHSIEKFDMVTAKNIIYYSLLERRLSANRRNEGLRSNGCCYMNTKLTGYKLYVDCVSDERNHILINKNVKIIHSDITAKNGIIHIVDKLLIPPPIF